MSRERPAGDGVDVAIVSPLHASHVERIRRVSPRLQVHHHPELLPTPRYEADHIGDPPQRDDDAQRCWREMLATAEVAFDVDYHDVEGFMRAAQAVRWIQLSSAGIGGLVQRYRLDGLGATLTTAAGVHARPLAEFVLFGMLAFAKNYPRARRQREARVWERFHNDDLEGSSLAIVGLGSIGREIARLVRPFGVRVTATKRHAHEVDPHVLGVDALYAPHDLHRMLEGADYVVVATPLTPETQGMIDAAAFGAMKQGSVLINIGRGAVVEEMALLHALKQGPLAGAVLDVAPQEPLPSNHPLWTLDNVILFPHSASTSRKENDRLVELFCDNLTRYLDGRPLRNVYDPARRY
ncbi:MAG: D-2-hydroxyacid dehydrogenase [Trueperaceae bacterium]|nr:D-2-hydroxyacid dehydrogenase [Trueperaceae bacterium]